jgi:hypothetical protein
VWGPFVPVALAHGTTVDYADASRPSSSRAFDREHRRIGQPAEIAAAMGQSLAAHGAIPISDVDGIADHLRTAAPNGQLALGSGAKRSWVRRSAMTALSRGRPQMAAW